MLGRRGSAGTGYVKIRPDTEGFGSELEQGLDREGTGAASRSGEKMATAMRAAFAGGVAIAAKSVVDFAGFDKGMREVFTLMPGISGEAMGKMEEQVKDFSSTFGVLPTETIPALYEALGAGVPADNVFTFLESAQKLARGGVTDLATAVDGLSSVTNAYGQETISAERASDIMFKTVQLGKGTVDEVASSLFNVTPVASALGVSFEDVGGALAALTAQGTPVSVATTQMRSLMAELGKDGTKASDVFKEMTGKTFPQFIAEGGTLSNALHVMDDAAFENGQSLIDMFGSIEAGQAALALMKGGGETFFDFSNQMRESAGSTQEAFEQMNEGLSATWDRLRARLAVSLINIGEAIAPSVEALGEFIALFLEGFSKIPGPLQAAALGFATISAGLIGFAKPILNAITLFSKLSKVFTLLAANPWVLIIAALITATILIVKNWDKVKRALSVTWDWIKKTAPEVGRVLLDVWRNVVDVLITIWNAIKSAAISTWNAITGAVVATWNALRSAAITIWNAVASFFVGIWNGIRTVAVNTATGIRDSVVGTWNALAAWSSAIWNGVRSTISQVWGAITSTISGAVSAIGGFLSGLLGTVQNIFSGIRSTIGGVIDYIVGIPGRIIGAFSGLADRIAGPIEAGFRRVVDAYNATIARLPGLPSISTISKGVAPTLAARAPVTAAPRPAFSPIAHRFASGTVAREPTWGVFGEYDDARRNPEIVSPIDLMRDTFLDSLADGGAKQVTQFVTNFNGPLIAEATIRDDRDVVTLSRDLAREVERRARGAGRRVGGVAVT